MTDIILQGICGRMGHALIEKISQRDDCRVVAGVDQQAGKIGEIPVYASLEDLPVKGVVIDFSSPAGSVNAGQILRRPRPALRALLHRPVQRGRG